jgi:carbon-monoxide dehydrogenase medium subunit
MPSYDYHRPKNLDEAWRLAAEVPGARFIAGGTDVMVRIREGKLRPSALISLRGLSELCRIDPGPPLRIGAGVTVSELIAHSFVAEHFPVLVRAAERLGSLQIRNSATVGGNLCNASPCADLATPLLVAEAEVELASREGTRKVPLSELFVAPGETRVRPGEIVTALIVDGPAPRARALFFKQGRVAMDIALASLCVLLELDGDRCVKARLAAGSVAPRPIRLPKTERLLEGHVLDERRIAEARASAAAEVAPISDVRASEAYRRQLIGVFTERALVQLTARSEA